MEFDFIIVGAGSSGCALAHRLATYRPKDSILLIEAGGLDISPFIHVPAAIIKAIGNPSLDWMHIAEPDITRNNKKDLWPAGKVLGGSSAINGMLYVRGSRHDYDEWSNLGCYGWSYEDVLPVFKRLEHTSIGDKKIRGRSGLVHINWLRTTHPLAHSFVRASQENELPFNDDYNGEEQSGVAYSQVTQSRGWRYHTARAYLWPGKKPSNIQIKTKSFVTKLLFEGKQCIGLKFIKSGKEFIAKSRRETILSAGTLGSPKILMLSGIGPEKNLKSLGIPIINNIKAVGKNLQDHPEVMLSIEVNKSTYNTEINSSKIIIHAMNWLLFGRGPATSPYPHAVAFLSSSSQNKHPDIQIQLGPYAFSFDENGVIPYSKPAISAAVNISYPKSRGEVNLRSINHLDSPVINHNMFSHPDDMKKLIIACKKVRKILNHSHLNEYRVAEYLPGSNIQTDDEWSDYLRNNAFLGYHPVGTCRMGIDNNTVVTPNLKVRNFNGLRIADASIIPQIISGNTNATAIMIGEKAADLIHSSN